MELMKLENTDYKLLIWNMKYATGSFTALEFL